MLSVRSTSFFFFGADAGGRGSSISAPVARLRGAARSENRFPQLTVHRRDSSGSSAWGNQSPRIRYSHVRCFDRREREWMGVRAGAEYLQGLRSSPRDVWVGGQRVDNVADHPAFCAVAREIAALYDMQYQPEHRDSLTALDAVTGERCGIAFEPAQTVDDLRRRREGFRLWAEASFGLLGRSPRFPQYHPAGALGGPERLWRGWRAICGQRRVVLRSRAPPRPVCQPCAGPAAERPHQTEPRTGFTSLACHRRRR
jgi:hypothetical protein